MDRKWIRSLKKRKRINPCIQELGIGRADRITDILLVGTTRDICSSQTSIPLTMSTKLCLIQKPSYIEKNHARARYLRQREGVGRQII